MSVIKSATPETVFVFRIELKNIKPKVWRRVVVPGDYTFKELHYVIMAVMGWSNHHMHKFYWKHPVTNQEIEMGGVGDLGFGDYIHLPESTKIAEIFTSQSQKVFHDYDFGSPWTHVIIFQKTLPATLGVKYPTCIGGKNCPPPEDDPGSDYSDSEHLDKVFDYKQVNMSKCRASIVRAKGVNGVTATNVSTQPAKKSLDPSSSKEESISAINQPPVTKVSTQPVKKSLDPSSSKEESISATNQPPAKRRLIDPLSSARGTTQVPETDQTNTIPNPKIIIVHRNKLNGSSSQYQQNPNILTEKSDAQSCDQQNNASSVSEKEIQKDEDVEGCFGKYIASQMRLIPDLEVREDFRCEIQSMIREFRFNK